MSLPIVQAVVSTYNHKFIPGSDTPFWIEDTRTVEVLTLNLNAGTMRVRFKDTDLKGNVINKVQDVDNSSFFVEYTINKKTQE